MSAYPELLQKQLDDYARLQEDLWVTTSERVFPALPRCVEARWAGDLWCRSGFHELQSAA